jgi:DNA (cytosine-5)-methyltransferase 1
LRKLTGFEALLLQGFSMELAKKAKGIVPEAHLLSQSGNAMTVTTIQAIAEQLIKII